MFKSNQAMAIALAHNRAPFVFQFYVRQWLVTARLEQLNLIGVGSLPFGDTSPKAYGGNEQKTNH